MGWFREVTLLLLWLAQLTLTRTMDLHISSTQSLGHLLFNGSLGTNWRYSFDPLRSSHVGLTFLSVHPRQGHVYVTQSVNCARLTHNPFSVYLNAKSEQKHVTYFVEFPLIIHVYGDDCKATDFRENISELRHSIDVKYTGSTVCFKERDSILSISSFMPQDLKSDHCHQWMTHPDFEVNSTSGDVSAIKESCLLNIVHIRGITVCDSYLDEIRQWPFHITLRSVDKSKKLLNMVGQLFNAPQRMKRSASYLPPTFPQNLYVEHIAEEQGPGVVVNTIAIDESETRAVTYSLLATLDGRSQDMFSIDPNSGQVTTSQNLDRESIAVHYFMVTATDVVNTRVNGQTGLTIYVDDINDHIPEFESQSYAQSVLESIQIGSTVLTVRASDGDEGMNAEVEYSILNPSGVNDAFQIDPRTGSITTRSSLDREAVTYYMLEIQASDRGAVPNRLASSAIVEITVMDENDNYPQFTQGSYTVDVSEDIDPSGQPVVAEIRAHDIDAGDNAMIRYSITGGNTEGVFAIDALSGQLSVLQSLDYETTNSYRLRIRAQDSGLLPKSNSTTVLVRVKDVNDNDPRFMTLLFQEAVLENVDVGYTVMRIQAYDEDAASNAEVLYSVIDQQADLPFHLDAVTGIITTNQLLDREVESHYTFKVKGRDQGSPPRSATATVEVNVRDINDNAPIFDPKIYEVIASEEDLPGTPVVTLDAHDADEDENGRVTYTITSGNARNAFSIISQMGQGLITVARTLNYADQNRYILTVTAADPGNLVDTATVIINVTDANTYRPTFQNTPYQVRVDEDAEIGDVVFRVRATDGDVGQNAEITYSVIDNDEFSINPVSGNISIKALLDREVRPGYTISVTATDHGRPPKSDTTDVEIIINDVNDNDPRFPVASYSGRISEIAVQGASILTISATDADDGLNGQIWYTFEGGNSGGGDFSLDPTLGILRTARPLDRERKASYELIAYGIDRGVPEHSTSVVINILVEDVNDNAPYFESSRINLEILENSPIGTTVDSIMAVDPDEGINAEISYSIVGGMDADSFSLSTRPNEPAVITSLVEHDFETGKTEYSIVVRALSAPLFSDVVVSIHVVDINDNMPQLDDFVIIFNNFRNHFPLGAVGKVPAFDPDVNDHLTYRFVSGNQAGLLSLEENTGDIRLDSRLNSDVPTNATLQVVVSDGINEVRATCRLFVRLVTDDMLYNSITIRLNQISQEAFLSPLYDRFVSALALIIPTSEDNVFIINVQDDTDVYEQILNVSFSVRRTVEDNQDVFYSQQFLRERVYLQRTLLTTLSTLEVLPFDDNLCVREPCLNYEDCVSVLRFGNASSFISSDTMLFRPIHPVNSFACRCPAGFTGMTAEYLCDTEVNLCYSSPCGGNGTCIRREGGYTCECSTGHAGDQCEFDMRHGHYESCPHDVCKSGSRCAPLIRGGFRCEKCPGDDHDSPFCEDCAELEDHTKFCELTTRSFPRGSFLMFTSLSRRHRFNIRLEFATKQRDAILLYNGRYNEMHDFIALEIVNGQVEFAFSLGTDITRVRTHIDGGVADGSWHEVTVDYLNRTATVTVGAWCDTGVAMQYATQMSNYSCAIMETQVLEGRCSVMTEPCHRFLDLTGPLQIGGLPGLITEFQSHNTDFEGCIRNVHIDEEFLDLKAFTYNNGTLEGCPAKKSFCVPNPCKHGGNCMEAWGTYQCDCPPEWGSKDCSQAIEAPRTLDGESYLLYQSGFTPTIQLPWYLGIGFRTLQGTAMLMSVDLGFDQSVNIELVLGLIHFIYPEQTIVLEDPLVNDGKWHFLEVRWELGQFIILLDYGQVGYAMEIDNWLNDRRISQLIVGGNMQRISGVDVVLDGFVGCIKDVRMGSTPNAILEDPQEIEIEPGCESRDECSSYPCPVNSNCVMQWNSHTCVCHSGYIGPNCVSICDHYNPCQNGGTCVMKPSSPEGYQCLCPATHFGSYCTESLDHPCPASWWGTPICGPCNCATQRGFDPVCNKTNGVCSCRENHYLPPGSDTCFPCNCYSIGSYSQSCDIVTGQCPCRSAVNGRQCDSCSSRFAEVTLRGCEVVYDSCPRSYLGNIWWDRTSFNTSNVQECPEGTRGDAVRVCSLQGWLEPNLFNCLSVAFVEVSEQLNQMETGTLKLTTFVIKDLMSKLDYATNRTEQFYGMDINVTYQIIKHVLKHEVQQTGLNLTHTQDRSFVQNLVNSLGRTLVPEYAHEWSLLEGSGGVTELMHEVEQYLETLARNMEQVFTNAFDAVHENMIIGLDFVEKENVTEFTIPKYNNKVQNPDMFDPETRAYIPMSTLSQASMKDLVSEIVDGVKPRAAVGYAMYKTIGGVLTKSYAGDVRIQEDVPLEVNAPVFSLVVIDDNRTVSGSISEPVTFVFKQLQSQNFSGPQCSSWMFTNGGQDGMWTTDGCVVVNRQEANGHQYVTCECSHLSTFTVLMDNTPIEYMEDNHIQIIMYTGLVLSIIFLVVTFFVLLCLRHIHSNANTIHLNFIFSVLVTFLVFICGINQINNDLACRIVAILLHFFFMCTFSWMFVDTLHIYRRMVEIRDINHGAMKFYFVLGYVLPGIVVGLAVGLNTDGYGNIYFCWLETSDVMFWSLAGPIIIAFVVTLILLLMAAQASCRTKAGDPDFAILCDSLKFAVVSLFLMAMVCAFALLAVNNNIAAFHYLFAATAFLEGIFVFLAHVVLSKQVRQELKYSIYRIQGKKGYDDAMCDSRATRSVLAYNHNDSSLDGGLNRMNMGISTNSTTSQSTNSKSSGYRHDSYMTHPPGAGLTVNGVPQSMMYPPNAGIPPYGYDSANFHDKPIDDPDTGENHGRRRRRKHRDSLDSDSELSGADANDIELASSHTSDDDEDDPYNRWELVPKHKALERVRKLSAGIPEKKSPSHSPKQSPVSVPSYNDGVKYAHPLGNGGTNRSPAHSPMTVPSYSEAMKYPYGNAGHSPSSPLSNGKGSGQGHISPTMHPHGYTNNNQPDDGYVSPKPSNGGYGSPQMHMGGYGSPQSHGGGYINPHPNNDNDYISITTRPSDHSSPSGHGTFFRGHHNAHGHWPGETFSTTSAGSDTEMKNSRPLHVSEVNSNLPGKLPNGSFRGRGDPLTPPERKDSLPLKDKVQVLTHNGSITSESEPSDTEDDKEYWA